MFRKSSSSLSVAPAGAAARRSRAAELLSVVVALASAKEFAVQLVGCFAVSCKNSVRGMEGRFYCGINLIGHMHVMPEGEMSGRDRGTRKEQ